MSFYFLSLEHPYLFIGLFIIVATLLSLSPIILLRVISRITANETKKKYQETRPLICPYCDSLNQPQFKFCAKCGGDLTNAKKKMI